ncbi:hypothetical protein [Desertivirga xinjiangensis]|uniref:hypothetical protein n=1 Tax=Desertivirga xinjiangensis TaxID=539206 RepID=UPI00210C67C4|nr:hypothetical protein [Pedobacter xinjiangensis]
MLTLHSYVRWFVLGSLLISIVIAWYGSIKEKKFSDSHDRLRHVTATIAHIQFTLGIILYFISPIVKYFMQNFDEAIHLREIRFFGMEHSLMMFVAVSVISVGSAKAKRKNTDRDKFKTMTIWFTIGLLIILSSIPWPFTGLVSRPYFRPF